MSKVLINKGLYVTIIYIYTYKKDPGVEEGLYLNLLFMNNIYCKLKFWKG